MKKYSELKIKIPPPIVTLVFASLMYLVSLIFSYKVPTFFQLPLVFFFIVMAGLFILPAVVSFYKNKTTVNPLQPEKASVLVIAGVYKYSRNPMYLGMAFFLTAWLIWLGNPINGLVLLGFVFYMNKFQIYQEETALSKIFGEQFELYKSKVRRWI